MNVTLRFIYTILPKIAIGASRSNKISCSENILVADFIKKMTSFSVNLTSVPTFLLKFENMMTYPLTERSFSKMLSTSSFFINLIILK